MSRRKEFFPEVTDQQWNDWHWQVKNRIETVDELKKYIKLTAEEEEGIRESLKTLRMAITPYYLTLIDPENPHCPIRKQAIPTVEELKRSPADLEDPLHEDSDSPVPGLTHRYPDRVLFLITDMCSMYCRHCTRRRFAGQHDCATPEKQIDDCIDYIARTPQVRDVLLSGGDALLVSDEKLELPSVLMLERSGENLFRHGRRIYATGIVTDKLFQLLRTQQREVELIIRDFTRVFASPEAFYAFLRRGHRIRVVHRSRLLAVTVNPTAPSGLVLDSRQLCEAMQEALQIPVYDVKKMPE